MLLLLLLVQEVDVAVETGFRRVHGSMRFDEAPAVGDTLDLHRDLGLTSWEPAVALRAGIRFDAHRLHASFGGFRAEGDDVTEAPIRWNETLFAAGERIEATLDWYELRMGWAAALPLSGDLKGGQILSGGVTLRYTRAQWKLTSDAQGSDDDNLGAFWPQVDLKYAGVPAGWRAELSFGGIRGPDLTALSASLMLGVTVPVGPADVSVSWQEEQISLLSTRGIQRNRMRWGWDGVVLEIAVRF